MAGTIVPVSVSDPVLALSSLPVSAKMPTELEPSVVLISPKEFTVMPPLRENDWMPTPPPPWVVMLPVLVRVTVVGASAKPKVRIPAAFKNLLLGSGVAAPKFVIVDATFAVIARRFPAVA
jgi:hypothetical protein